MEKMELEVFCLGLCRALPDGIFCSETAKLEHGPFGQ